jgi:hypothetical protein
MAIFTIITSVRIEYSVDITIKIRIYCAVLPTKAVVWTLVPMYEYYVERCLFSGMYFIYTKFWIYFRNGVYIKYLIGVRQCLT